MKMVQSEIAAATQVNGTMGALGQKLSNTQLKLTQLKGRSFYGNRIGHVVTENGTQRVVL